MYAEQAIKNPAFVSGLSAGAVEAPQSAIAGALESLSGEQKRTRVLLERLTDRIQPILSGAVPDQAKGVNGHLHASQLHGDILNRVSAQAEINVVLDDLLSRVTV